MSLMVGIIPLCYAASRAQCFSSDTSLMLHFNGSNTSTTFTDSSFVPKSIARSGDTQIRTERSKFGGGSVFFDGAGDYLTTQDDTGFDFSSGSWTVDAWVYPLAWGVSGSFLWMQQGATGSDRLQTTISSTGQIVITILSSGSTVVSTSTSGNVVALNTWSHIATAEQGNSYKIFINGVDMPTSGGTDTDRPANYSGNWDIGRLTGSSFYYNGYIDEFRVTKNKALWTSTFTPPSSELYPCKRFLTCSGD